MIGAPFPQDVLDYSPKFALNLTAREAAFYTVGAVACVATFMTLNDTTTYATNIKAMISACVGLPVFVWGKAKPFGQPLEKIIVPFLMDNILSPRVRLKENHFEEYEERFERPLKSSDIRDRAKKSKEFKGIS